jgi:hypothetical protein
MSALVIPGSIYRELLDQARKQAPHRSVRHSGGTR